MKLPSLKKAASRLLFATAASITVGYAATVAWTLSGSGKWELQIDEGGVQVYTLKAPGSYLKQFKGVTRAPYTQSQIVASLMLDNGSLDNCKQWIPVCVGLKVLEPYNDKAQGDSVLWTLELLPPLFANREYAIKSYAAQDPLTKLVTVDILAAANKVPLDDCCLRITHIHNRWQVAPAEQGLVEVQLVQDYAMGGFFPDLIVNLSGAGQTHELFHDLLPGLLNKPKYRAARFDYVTEGGSAQPAAQRGS